MELQEEQEEIIANVPIYRVPADEFPTIVGPNNYDNIVLHHRVNSPEQFVQQRSASIELDTLMATKPKLNILIFLGSVREGRNCVRVGKFIQKALEARQHRVTIIDPKENNLAQVNQPFQFYKSPAQPPEALVALNKKVQEADAFIAISAEYNSAASPALYSLMDQCPPQSYSYRPSAIVVYSMGQFGGIRASTQLRQFLSDLLTVHVPGMVVIPKVHEMLSPDGTATTPSSIGPIAEATENMIDQLEFYACAIANHKKASGLPKSD